PLGPPLIGIDSLHMHPRRTTLREAELLGRGEGQVDDAVGVEGAAIVDAQDDLAPVVQVGDLHVAGQGQGLVGGGHAVQVVTFAVGGELVVELGAVPGGDAGFPVVARVAD